MYEKRLDEINEVRRQHAVTLLQNLLDATDDEEMLEDLGADLDTREDAFALLSVWGA